MFLRKKKLIKIKTGFAATVKIVCFLSSKWEILSVITVSLKFTREHSGKNF